LIEDGPEFRHSEGCGWLSLNHTRPRGSLFPTFQGCVYLVFDDTGSAVGQSNGVKCIRLFGPRHNYESLIYHCDWKTNMNTISSILDWGFKEAYACICDMTSVYVADVLIAEQKATSAQNKMSRQITIWHLSQMENKRSMGSTNIARDLY
jgi:hypothetical protein